MNDLPDIQSKAPAQKAKDENMARLLKDVRAFLPNLRREGGGKASDYLVHPTTLAHLRRLTVRG